MRRLLSFILFLCFTIGVMAQSDYGLTVAGTPVTSANKSDILGDGKVSYDPTSHTLRLKNANIETGTSAVFTEDRLIIDLEGTNSFIAPRGVESIYNPTSASDYAITICSSSGGSLSTEGYESAFSVANSGGIYVRDCSITTKQSMSAFYGYISGNNTTLKIEHANIDIQGQSTEACIAGFESLVLEKCDIVEPTNAYFKSAWGYGAMRQGDDDTKCISLKIKAKEATEYGISVSTLGDEVVSVNSENYTNVLGDGSLSYNPETNVLKMNDVHLFGFAVLDICKKDLCVEVSGTQNSIEGFCMINTSCTLVGSNTKKSVTSQLNVSSLAWSSSLTIQDLAVEFIGGKHGLQTQSGSASLMLKNATVNANGAEGVFKSIPSLVLEDCVILTPEGAYYDAEKKYIVDESGNRVTGVVTIGPKVEPVVEYGIRLLSSPYDIVEITTKNCADVLGDGTLSYDPETNVLLLNNLQAPEKTVIIGSFSSDPSFEAMKAMNKDLAGIKVKVTGDNALEHLSFYGGVDGTLCGDGTLVLEEPNMTGSAISSFDNLLIEDCNLVLTAPDGNGINMYYDLGWGCPGKLTIRNASVKINAGGYYCIGDFSSLVLEGCSILKPFGTDPAKLNGSTGNGEFIIGPENMVVEFGIRLLSSPYDIVEITTKNCADVLGDGTVSYDPVANVLSLNNLQAPEKEVIIGSFSSDPSFEAMKAMNKYLAGIKVKVTGDNALEHLSFYGGVDGTLCGDGTLVLEQPNMTGSAISSFDNLLIEDCNLVLTAPDGNGINMYYGFGWGCPGKLTIRNASVKINADGYCIHDFSSLVLEGCSILKPSGIDPAKLNGSTEGGELVIGRDGSDVPVTEYNIKVGSTKVTKANCADVLGNGTVSYDPVANVLSLNNLQAAEKSVVIGSSSYDLSFETMKAMNKDLAGIKVKVTGNNALESLHFYGGVNGTICGDGNLVLEDETTANSTLHSWDNLLIEDCNLVLKAPNGYGIYMWNDWGAPGKLTIRNASVKINAGGSCIDGFSDLVLEGCRILKPFGTDPAKLNGSTGNGEFIIGPENMVVEYGIWIKSSPYDKLEITSENCADVLGDGTVSYDPATNVLSLNNLQAPDKYLTIGELSEDMSIQTMESLNGGLAGIKVTVIGDNALKNLCYYGGVNGTLCGDGNLLLQENMDGPTPALHSWDNLLIEDCNLVARGGIGIEMWGLYGAPGKLTIRNATIKIESSLQRECIESLTDLVLDGCYIYSPAGAHYDKEKQAIVDKDGKDVKGNLIIRKGAPQFPGSGTEDDPFILSEGTTFTTPVGEAYYKYTATEDCVMQIEVKEESGVTGDISYKWNFLDYVYIEKLESREMLMRKGVCYILRIVSTDPDNEVTIKFRDVADGEIWYKAIPLNEGDNPLPAIDSEKKPVMWYKLPVPAGTRSVCTFTDDVLQYPDEYSAETETIWTRGNLFDMPAITKPQVFFFSVSSMPEGGNANVKFEDAVEPVYGFDLMFYDEVTYVTTWLDSKNSTDVFDDGTVSYDFYANVLTLNNAVKNNLRILPNVEGIMSKPFTMKLVGDNSFKLFVVQRKLNCNICGDGKLSLSGNCGVMGGDLLIEDCQLDIDGGRILLPEDGVLGKLTIRNATVRINSENSCIDEISDLVLEGCTILKPFGAYFDPAQHAVVDKDGNPVKGELVIGKFVTPDKGTGTQDDPFELGGTLDEILGGGGTGGTGTGGTGGGSTSGGGTGTGTGIDGTGTGIDGTGTGKYPNPPVIITPPAGTGSHYSYTAKDDCVLGLIVNVGNEFEGRLTINGADAGKIEEREMILHKGDVVMLNIVNAGKDDIVGINIRKLCEGDLWNWAIELKEGKNDILKVVEYKNIPRWYKVTAPAKTPMAINIDAKGKAYVFTDENVEQDTPNAWFWTMSEGDGIAYDYNNASSTPLTFYVKLIAAEKDCTATVSFDPTAIDILSSESDNAPAYNLQGLRVGNDYKGIVIINGKKVLKK